MTNDLLSSCRLCSRNCGVDRTKGEPGFCRAGKDIKVARASLHKWEEPCISGERGSGTVFFSNCNLRCVFCQNHEISQGGAGREITVERLGEIFIELMEEGAHNINLVTPTHYVPQIIQAIRGARQRGLNIPVIYNTNCYENVETVKMLEGYVDVYLPDIKYFDDKYARKYSGVSGYFINASSVLKEMVSQLGEVKFSRKGLMLRGVMIRHLMIPGLLFDSKKVIEHIHANYGGSVYISLMNQYTPMYKAKNYSEINKPLNPGHYQGLIQYCLSLGISNAFVQEEGTASDDFVPPFNLKGV